MRELSFVPEGCILASMVAVPFDSGFMVYRSVSQSQMGAVQLFQRFSYVGNCTVANIYP